MANRKTKKPTSRRGQGAKNAPEKARKLTQRGTIKHKKGDLKMTTSKKTGFKVKQRKGGAWMRVGDRECKIHTVCDCVKRTDVAKQAKISNRNYK
jgi:hypothetical protein